MKKKWIALAALGAVMGPAFAQSNVTIYGLLDAAIVHESGSAAGSSTRLSSGVQSGSRLGFKGVEDLGGGLSAKFQLESGILLDTGASAQGGVLYGRQALVGLAGGFGEVTTGRQYTPYLNALDAVDPFGTGSIANSQNLFVDGPSRMTNSIIYATPGNLGGFSAAIAYGFGEVAGNISANRQLGFSAAYESGPLFLTVAHHDSNNATGSGGTKVSFAGGTWNFGMAKLHLAAGNNDASGLKSRDMLAGVTVPFGQSSVMLSYVHKDDRSAAGNDASQLGLGYSYALSQRTNLYASYARISNDNAAAYTVGDATNGYAGNKGMAVGIRHRF
ncbi:MAG TPA: porin [Noviherbaspirillum sp.]|nr:porin [Noviherbaspirillum sp.]